MWQEPSERTKAKAAPRKAKASHTGEGTDCVRACMLGIGASLCGHLPGALKPKYRQAKAVHGIVFALSIQLFWHSRQEEDAVVEVLCFSCRRASDASVQLSVTSFFKKAGLSVSVAV